MNVFRELLGEVESALKIVEATERVPEQTPHGYISPLAGDPAAVH